MIGLFLAQQQHQCWQQTLSHIMAAGSRMPVGIVVACVVRRRPEGQKGAEWENPVPNTMLSTLYIIVYSFKPCSEPPQIFIFILVNVFAFLIILV